MGRVVILVSILSGCSLGPPPEPCDPLAADCPERLGISVIDAYSDQVSSVPMYVANGGVATLAVDDKGREGAMTLEVFGGELLEQQPRQVRVRALGNPLSARAEIDDLEGVLELPVFAVEQIKIAPSERQFKWAAGAVEFAVVRGARVPVTVQLFGPVERLIDQTVVVTGPGVAEQGRWDSIVLDGAADSIAVSIMGDSGAAEIAVPIVPPEIDQIAVVSGPALSNPEQPITVTPSYEAIVCFTGMAGGIAVAGLEWTLQGAGVDPLGGACAMVNRSTDTLTVSAAGISRSFEIDLVEP